jgi:hypothetical protein
LVDAEQIEGALLDLGWAGEKSHRGSVGPYVEGRCCELARSCLALIAPNPNVTPREWMAVVSSSARAVASFAAGPLSRATMSARTKFRRRSGPSGKSWSNPIRRAMPDAAATCPCGNARTISKPSPASHGRHSELDAQVIEFVGATA